MSLSVAGLWRYPVKTLAGEATDSEVARYVGAERFDVLPLLVATDGAVKEFGRDIRRLRPNILIGGVKGMAERTWENRTLTIGDAVIRLDSLRARCPMTTVDPDTITRDPSVLRDLGQRFGGKLGLNAEVLRRSDYPPKDPTVGGALGLMSRAFPHSGIDLRDRVRALSENGSVPGAPEWRWIFTPGHTAGHVSLFRERDRALIAGDALATVNQDSPRSMFNLRSEVSVPPAPLTTDWGAARASVERLADLRPYIIGAGHGSPVRGPHVADDPERFASAFTPPTGGRCSDRPAITDEGGVGSMPPPVPDTLPRNLLIAGLMAGGAYLAFRNRRGRADSCERSSRDA